MERLQSLKRVDHYTRIEIIFFTLFFIVFPILTDVEYGLYEPVYIEFDMSFPDKVFNRMVFGLFEIPAYLFLYKFIINRLLIKKRYLIFLVSFPLFLIALNLYKVYGEYWVISKLTFLPTNITQSADKWFHAETPMHFSIIYVIKETLELAALAYFIHYAKQEKKMNALKQAKLETDLNYLKAQIQPHFFFNTLNNIYSLAQQQSTHTAQLVAQLAEMMRYIIYETTQAKVALLKQTAFLKNYVAVESVRYGSRISITFDTQGIHETATIEPLLLLPFVENVFKHGIQEEINAGFAEIIICLNENQLTLETRNSKPEIKKSNSMIRGIGLENSAKRLNLLYPGKHSFMINETDNRYELILNLYLN